MGVPSHAPVFSSFITYVFSIVLIQYLCLHCTKLSADKGLPLHSTMVGRDILLFFFKVLISCNNFKSFFNLATRHIYYWKDMITVLLYLPTIFSLTKL